MRHPNYLGEMLIYASFALMVRHWIPWVILGFIWTFVFMTNIAAQEASLSRHPGWHAYRARTGLCCRKSSECETAIPCRWRGGLAANTR